VDLVLLFVALGSVDKWRYADGKIREVREFIKVTSE
jgi:hypothetical protein